MRGTVLVVEDDQSLRELLRRYLERAGYDVVSTGLGAHGLAMLERGGPDLLVLDLGLPDVDGLSLLQVATDRRVPVVVLTARVELEDRLRGLKLGADDYVTKPFSPRELVLRVQAVLRRTAAAQQRARTSYGAGAMLIDEERHELRVRGRPVALTPTEWNLLAALAARPGRVLTRAELVNRLRGYEFEGNERTVDSHVKNLRRKLRAGYGRSGGAERPTDVVDTVPGVGYRLDLERDA